MALDALIHRQRPSWGQRCLKAPYETIANTLCSLRPVAEFLTCSPQLSLTVVCLSDTHNEKSQLPHGDILIHVGDLTQNGTAKELQAQLDWLGDQPHRHKIVVAGNHDIVLDPQKCVESGMSPLDRKSLRRGSIIYLENSSTTVKLFGGRSLTIYGYPWTRRHGNGAFQYDKGVDMFTNRIGDGVDILITHSPPKFHLDLAGWGDEFLLKELWRVRPKLHVFGHIHEGHGQEVLAYDRFEYLYEQVRGKRAGMFALVWMALLLLWGWVRGGNKDAHRTMLVNASSVGGLRDQDKHKTQAVQI